MRRPSPGRSHPRLRVTVAAWNLLVRLSHDFCAKNLPIPVMKQVFWLLWLTLQHQTCSMIGIRPIRSTGDGYH